MFPLSYVNFNPSHLTIFHPQFRLQEKTQLMERINQFIQIRGFCPGIKRMIDVILHPEFNIFVSDAPLLFDLAIGYNALALSVIKNNGPLTHVGSHKLNAQNLAEVYSNKAGFPFFKIPEKVAREVLSYLSLPELSSLMKASCQFQARHTVVLYLNPVKTVLLNYPNLIVDAPRTSNKLKLRVLSGLYREPQMDINRINRLFHAVYQSEDQQFLHYTLGRISIISFMGHFLASRPENHQNLGFDFRDQSLFPPLHDYMNYSPLFLSWLRLYSKSTKLTVAFCSDDSLSLSLCNGFAKHAIPLLTAIKHLHLTFEGTTFRSDKWNPALALMFSPLKHLSHLKLTFIPTDPPLLHPHFVPDAAFEQLAQMSAFLIGNLTIMKTLLSLEVEVEYHPTQSYRIRQWDAALESSASVLYLKYLFRGLSAAFAIPAINEVKLSMKHGFRPIPKEYIRSVAVPDRQNIFSNADVKFTKEASIITITKDNLSFPQRIASS